MNNTTYPHQYLYGWTGIVTLTTCIAGIISILEGAGIGTGLFIPDIPGGCILLLIAALFATAVIKGRTDRPGWISFSYIGALLLVVFAGCAILVETGHFLTLIMEGEEAHLLTIVSSSFIWAAILAIPLLIGVSRLLYGCSCGGDCCE
ncbi:hypothetical protein [Methanospirillum hungatei]|jgi:hypothetical protein|uniref:hypothetical protein n=1 Tax=Methanospirillum hungatei TaxID=2203 RepID=UPI0009C9CFA4|nr:hypothetical protein [Methanospirillum hungatei]MBP9007544.1 hypothetical protein [Methanospirillum sp.]OQA57163.1 MAG: hypothetical protein BWY45_01547 [Euryarchaeota archaeon ADurb.Bin294]HOW05840.1 hypothetical protein [Methanospirillum hungatei]